MGILNDDAIEQRRLARRGRNLASNNPTKASPLNSISALRSGSDSKVLGGAVRRRWQPGDPFGGNYYFGSEENNGS